MCVVWCVRYYIEKKNKNKKFGMSIDVYLNR